jgi:hypothetical protein
VELYSQLTAKVMLGLMNFPNVRVTVRVLEADTPNSMCAPTFWKVRTIPKPSSLFTSAKIFPNVRQSTQLTEKETSFSRPTSNPGPRGTAGGSKGQVLLGVEKHGQLRLLLEIPKTILDEFITLKTKKHLALGSRCRRARCFRSFVPPLLNGG